MNNEEKILMLLEKHGEMLEKHGEMLEKHSKILDILRHDMADVKERVAKLEVTQENIIIPQIQALAEGQKTILETLAPKNRVEALEDEMVFMKSVVRALSQEIAELKKAQ